MIPRETADLIQQYRKKFPVITLTGVRQCGKSTLLRSLLPDAVYVSLEEPDNREIARMDPRGFLKQYPAPVIIDEAQRVPELFSYLQTVVDLSGNMGGYLLSGSQNFLLMQGVSQSLAGRCAVLRLLPLSVRELKESGLLKPDLPGVLLTGGYPALYDRNIEPQEYFPSYVQTYIERDIRLLRNIAEADTFLRFVRLCASRSGQILNYADLARCCGITVPTARAWISALETSHLIFLLRPYYRNFEKRMVKSPKLYFFDSGLLCHLLDIHTAEALRQSTAYGAVFETFVISEYHKSRLFKGQDVMTGFFRDTNGNEIDLIAQEDGVLRYYEIKAGETRLPKYLETMRKIGQSTGVEQKNMTCIYGGDASVFTDAGNFLSYRELDSLSKYTGGHSCEHPSHRQCREKGATKRCDGESIKEIWRMAQWSIYTKDSSAGK